MWANVSLAQDDLVWVQVEAQPSLTQATERARAYADVLPDVNGFSLGAGWYGIALGPYTREDADAVLRSLRADGRIPNDSFIAFPRSFRQQFWPIGANLSQPAEAAQTPSAATALPTDPDVPVIQVADETRNEALQSERSLTLAQREALQTALQWAGSYQGAIDGAFGRGTRAAMADWQRRNGFDNTGVLTTQQRAQLLGDYNAVLNDIGFDVVEDNTAGMQIGIPTALVEFDRYEYPFAHYTPRGSFDATVLLISKTGNQRALQGLYDVMQTLDIFPLEGAREIDNGAFSIIGTDDMRVSEARVQLINGEIKGFVLVWPVGDEARRIRLIEEMERSLIRTEGTIPISEGADAQPVDLVAGLSVRKPKLSRSGFFVSEDGLVLTTEEAVMGCTRISIDGSTDAEVIASDADTGAALLQPSEALSPRAFAQFRTQTPRLASQIAVAGYSFEGVLNAPSVTFGTLNDIKGLQGNETEHRLTAAVLPGDIGGPVLDMTGAVIGQLQPHSQPDRVLPDDVVFARNADTLRAMLTNAGRETSVANELPALDDIDLAAKARQITVLVSCWD